MFTFDSYLGKVQTPKVRGVDQSTISLRTELRIVPCSVVQMANRLHLSQNENFRNFKTEQAILIAIHAHACHDF